MYAINMYPLESPDFAEKLIERKEAARQTLRPTSREELHALVHELFPDGTTPGRRRFQNSSMSTRQNQPFSLGELNGTLTLIINLASNF